MATLSRPACALCFWAVIAVGGTARAADGDGPYEIHWSFDLPIIAGGAALWLLPASFTDELIEPSCPCRRAAVSPIDSGALGRHSAAAKTASDLGVTAVTLGVAALDALDVQLSGGRWVGLASDLTVLTEVLVVNGAINEVIKLAVRRPRPVAYDAAPGSVESTDPDNYLSFYSGHTSTTFALGVGYASTFALRHPESAARFWVYGAAVAAGAGMGVLRVLAGKHFPTDVLAGAAMGSAVGVMVPWFHVRGRQAVAMPLDGGALFILGGRF